MIALIRYTWADAVRSQRWVAPLLVFLGLEAVIDASSGSVLPTYAISAVILLFVSTWITMVISNSEDSLQVDVTMAAAGGQAKVRLAKLLTAYLVAVGLGILGLVGPAVASSRGVTVSDVGAGAMANLVTALAGVALGALCSHPIIRRTAWALFIAVVIDLADVVVPSGIPARRILVLFNQTEPSDFAMSIGLVAIETLAIAVVAIAVSGRLARIRS